MSLTMGRSRRNWKGGDLNDDYDDDYDEKSRNAMLRTKSKRRERERAKHCHADRRVVFKSEKNTMHYAAL